MKNRWVASVCAESAGGAAVIADLFVERGAKSFGYIAGSAGSHASNERLRGYQARLRRHGFSQVQKIDGDYHYDGGYEAVLSFSRIGPIPDAIFCGNDLMALGAMDALLDTDTAIKTGRIDENAALDVLIAALCGNR